MTFVAPSVASMFGKDMSLIFQVEQCPVIVVATQIDAASTPSVTSVGATIGLILHVAQVHGAPATFSRTAVNLYIVYEVGVHWLIGCIL